MGPASAIVVGLVVFAVVYVAALLVGFVRAHEAMGRDEY
jgi:hypothetical protein